MRKFWTVIVTLLLCAIPLAACDVDDSEVPEPEYNIDVDTEPAEVVVPEIDADTPPEEEGAGVEEEVMEEVPPQP